MPIKWIVFNGSKHSGKSTAAKHMRMVMVEILRRSGKPHRVIIDSFAAPMKHFIATMLGEKYSEMDKEKMRPELNGYSVREFLIHMSEEYIKPRYGNDTFVRTLMHRSLRNIPAPDWVIIDDAGFLVEAEGLTKPIIIRLERNNTDFTGDSRAYWPDSNFVVDNNRSFQDFYEKLTEIAYEIV